MTVKSILPRKNLGSADTTRDYSPNIWWDCQLDAMQKGELAGYVDGDDFLPPGMISEDAVDDLYQKYIDTGNTIRLVAASTTVVGGQLALITDATDNDAPVIQRHGANAATGAIGPFLIGNTAAATFPLWFEARVKVSSIADDIIAFCCGLASVGCAADNGLQTDNSGDVVDSLSFIGWRTKHVNSGTAGQNALLDFVYQDGGQTAPVVTLASAATLVADTFIKVGFKYTPREDNTTQIKLFLNNIEQSTYVTKANIDATTFPENDPLAFVLGFKNGTAGAATLTIDWWRCAQQFALAAG